MRIVIKIGTSTITHPTGRLNIRQMEALCKVLSDLKNAGNEVILVSSGAIGMGVGKLRLGKKPVDVPTKQASAAVGQCELMYTYDKLFSEYRHTVAQILLTADDIADPARHENFQNTIQRLLELDAIPIINENDTVSVAEFGIGDNDTLSAIVATSVRADLLVLLSDIDGLYTADPHKNPDAQRIDVVPEITDDILRLAEGKGSELGTGGMKTKLSAAQIVTKAGTDMIIANGADVEQLYALLDGRAIGTRFTGKKADAWHRGRCCWPRRPPPRPWPGWAAKKRTRPFCAWRTPSSAKQTSSSPRTRRTCRRRRAPSPT